MKKIYDELWFRVMVAMVLGVATGIVLSPSGLGLLSQKTAELLGPWIALPGNLFLSMIKMVVIPLVLSSIILGITSSDDTSFLKKISLRIFPYFIATTVVATSLGAGMALLIQPGNYIDATQISNIMEDSKDKPPVAVVADKEADASDEGESEPPAPLPEQIVSIIPTNYIKSALEQDMMATVILALFLGMAIVTLSPGTVKPVLELIEAVQAISMKIIDWAMKITPVAVFGLICNITMRVGFDAVFGMAAYMGSVIAGLFILFLFYLFIVGVFGKMSPFAFLKRVSSVQLLAFSTSSSAATIPLAMTTAQERLGVRPTIARFIVPLGATINMDGTALYQVCATVFLSQVYGVEMGFLTLVTVILTTVGASIGTPSTPGVGIVILATILQGIGVPPSGIALIIGVDRILDMTRTTVNVTGDLVATVVMNRLLKNVGKDKE